MELADFEALNLHPIACRKEVKNTNLVRNFVSSFEDRYLCLANLSSPDANQVNVYATHLVVFKKYLATGTEAKKKISAAAQTMLTATQNHIRKQIDDYTQNKTPVGVNPYLTAGDADGGNPLASS